jgi:hypothetical protein
MADAWSTVVTREPEWDDYGRAEIYALIAYESGQCPRCGNYDVLVPQPKATDRTAEAPDGRQFDAAAYRCVSCALKDLAERVWRQSNQGAGEPNGPHPSDGLMFVARPRREEDTNG